MTEEASRRIRPCRGRYAAFDNDGTLWCRSASYIHLAFARGAGEVLLDTPGARQRAPGVAPRISRSRRLLEGDMQSAREGPSRRASSRSWRLRTAGCRPTKNSRATARGPVLSAQHPRFGRPYTDHAHLPAMACRRSFACRSATSSATGGQAGHDPKFIGRRPSPRSGNPRRRSATLQWTAAGAAGALRRRSDHTDAEREFEYRVSLDGRLELGAGRGARARLDGRQHEKDDLEVYLSPSAETK